MVELIKNFGLNPYLLIAQIINFLIILYLLKRFAYKPILTVLDKRRKLIEDSVKQAEESKKALEDALVKEKEILRNAQSESKKILTEANKKATEIIDKAHEKGKQQTEKLLIDAQTTLKYESEKIEKALAAQTVQIATEMLQKTLEGFFDEAQQKEVVQKAIEKLNK